MKDNVTVARSWRGAVFGGLVAALTLALDQTSKMWVLHGLQLPLRGHVPVMPTIDFVMVWNRGISYGLFQQDTPLGRTVLLLVTLAASAFLIRWILREDNRLSLFALGLVLGGAIGNGIDRLAYGAVVDFVLFHIGSFQWYVFNIADAAIVVGVALLLYGALRRGDRSA